MRRDCHLQGSVLNITPKGSVNLGGGGTSDAAIKIASASVRSSRYIDVTYNNQGTQRGRILVAKSTGNMTLSCVGAITLSNATTCSGALTLSSTLGMGGVAFNSPSTAIYGTTWPHMLAVKADGVTNTLTFTAPRVRRPRTTRSGSRRPPGTWVAAAH